MKNNRLVLVIMMLAILTIGNIGMTCKNIYDTKVINSQIEQMVKIEQDRNALDKTLVETVQTMTTDVNELKSRNVLRQTEVSRGGNIHRVIPKKEISRLNRNTDLCEKIDISVDDMNKIIDDWDSSVRGGTAFKGKGEVFIKASEETGLNPVYILAHAAWESKWGNSYLAKNKGNYFGINAVDADPGKAYHMGSSVDDGIIAGAKWIKGNYYNRGYVTLNDMIYKGNYASDADRWINGIVSIVNSSYRVV